MKIKDIESLNINDFKFKIEKDGDGNLFFYSEVIEFDGFCLDITFTDNSIFKLNIHYSDSYKFEIDFYSLHYLKECLKFICFIFKKLEKK